MFTYMVTLMKGQFSYKSKVFNALGLIAVSSVRCFSIFLQS